MNDIRMQTIVCTSLAWVTTVDGHFQRQRENALFGDAGDWHNVSEAEDLRRVYQKCPFCGHRQNVREEGANCRACGGDVLA